MAYVAVTWTSGDVITEAKLDNMTGNDIAVDSHENGVQLLNNKYITGKEVGGTARNLVGMNTADEVSVGNSTDLLRFAGIWDSDVQHSWKLTRTVDLSLTTATFTTVAWGSEEWDTGGLHSNSVNPSRVTIDKAGRYLIGATLRFDANTTGRRELRFLENGSSLNEGHVINDVVNTEWFLTGSVILELAASDYVEVQAYQDSGGNLNLDLNSKFWGFKLA